MNCRDGLAPQLEPAHARTDLEIVQRKGAAQRSEHRNSWSTWPIPLSDAYVIREKKLRQN